MPIVTQGNSLKDDPVHMFNVEMPFPLHVTSDGTVSWTPAGQLHASCTQDMFKFPKDEHECPFYLFFFGYTHNQVQFGNITFEDSSSPNSTWVPDGQWELGSTEAVIETNNQLFGSLKSLMKMKVSFVRLPDFFVMNMLFPTCALSFLNMLVFTLPVSSGEKVSKSLNIFITRLHRLRAGVLVRTQLVRIQVKPLKS